MELGLLAVVWNMDSGDTGRRLSKKDSEVIWGRYVIVLTKVEGWRLGVDL